MKIPDIVKTYLPEPGDLSGVSDHIFEVTKNIEERRANSKKENKEIVILTGLSGSGKDTIIDRLMMGNNKYKKIKTCTTRERRPEESEADDPYVRVTKKELEKMMDDGSALECVEYAGNFYCTSKTEIDKVINENKIPILRVDPKGARFFIEANKNGHRFLKDYNFTYLFVVPSSFDDLVRRLINRGSTISLLSERLAQSRKDIDYVGDAQYIIVNEYGRLDEVIDEVNNILR